MNSVQYAAIGELLVLEYSDEFTAFLPWDVGRLS